MDAAAACDHESAYGGYTRAARYRDWIAEKDRLLERGHAGRQEDMIETVRPTAAASSGRQ